MSVRFSPGVVLQVSVGEGRSAYALMLGVRPYIAFFPDGQVVSDLPEGDPLFIVAVHNKAYSRGRWGSVLRRIDPATLPEIPNFFRQNLLNPEDCEIAEAVGKVRQATPEECVGLERSAVWEAEHVEQRISDVYAGRPNLFVESMKVKLRAP
ncbi:hypothetical protein [Streptomyces sp. CB03238]|uniref:hypothetical protein n=1 Tax=Streptomyces sp. CB03238 TaxID=1907777 RepID=UPI00117E70E2|nr:hypothetical protein [Streptomyces sp. CB03238]